MSHSKRQRPHGLLDTLLGDALPLRVLRHFCHVRSPATGRALAKALGVSHPTIGRAVRPLLLHHILEARPAGAAILYELNEHHWLVATAIRPLFAAEGRFGVQLAGRVQDLVRTPLTSLILFGSVAQGTATPDSDIDLLCVMPTAAAHTAVEERLHTAGPALQMEFGHPVNWLLWSLKDLRRRHHARDPLLRNILNTGEVLMGRTFSEMIR